MMQDTPRLQLGIPRKSRGSCTSREGHCLWPPSRPLGLAAPAAAGANMGADGFCFSKPKDEPAAQRVEVGPLASTQATPAVRTVDTAAPVAPARPAAIHTSHVTPPALTQAHPATMSSPARTRVAVIFYSTWGHIKQMAERVKAGIDAVEGCEGVLYQVAETLAPEIVEKMKAPPKPWPDVPVIQPNELADFDGLIFGVPTRFGMMSAQMKALFDATGQLWVKGGLIGKPAAVFVSVGTQGGGIETTALTSITQFSHHGMIFVPCGYGYGAQMYNLGEVHAATPYGACTYAGGQGERQPSEFELGYATYQGEYFAMVVKKLAGK